MNKLAVVTVVLALGGCMHSLGLVGSGTRASPPARTSDPLTVNFEGKSAFCEPESKFVPYGTDRRTAADKIRFAICRGNPRSDVYDVLDEKLLAGSYDHVEAAILVITCVGHGKCEFRDARPVHEGECFSGHCTFSPSKTAGFAIYANRTTGEDVQRAVASADVPSDIKSAFVARYEACRRHVLDAVAALDPRRRAIYVDTIAAAREQRRADDAVAAPFAARVAALKEAIDTALLDKRPSRVLLDQALALRSQFMTSCTNHGRSVVHCWSGRISRPLTKLVTQLAIALDDLPLAATENAGLLIAPSHEDAGVDIHLAVRVALAGEAERWRAWSEAKGKGVDENVLARKFGNPPPLDLTEEPNEAGYAPPGILEFSSSIESSTKRANVRLAKIARAIRRVERKGNVATISFVEIVTKHQEQVGCRETNKLDHVTASGDVIYREDCSSAKWITEVHRDRVEPIVVPASDVVRLAPNAYVTAIVDEKTRKGHIVSVFASAERASAESPRQIRGFRSD